MAAAGKLQPRQRCLPGPPAGLPSHGSWQAEVCPQESTPPSTLLVALPLARTWPLLPSEEWTRRIGLLQHINHDTSLNHIPSSRFRSNLSISKVLGLPIKPTGHREVPPGSPLCTVFPASRLKAASRGITSGLLTSKTLAAGNLQCPIQSGKRASLESVKKERQ